MKKIINYINRYDNVFVCFLIVISLLGITLNITLESCDELWNFQNIYKMYNGFTIYKDANVICTPLFFIIGNILFNILGANFFVFRLYSVIIYTFYFFITYKILTKIKLSKKISIIVVFLMMMFNNYEIPRVMANYNYLAMGFAITGIYLILNNKEKNFNIKNIILQATLSFIILLTKQNIGVFYILFISTIILIKSDKKIKDLLKYYGIICIYIAIMFSIMLVKGNLIGFINYALVGIKQFAQKNILINKIELIISIFILLINTITTYVLIKKVDIDEEIKNNLCILEIASICMSFTIFPIINFAHFMMAINISIILLIYIIDIIIKNIGIKITKGKVLKIITIMLIVIAICISFIRFFKWKEKVVENQEYYKYKEPFFGSIVSEKQKENIENVTNYIKKKEETNKNVIVFSSKAALYMVPLKKSNGYCDLPFYGNFGNLKEQDIINQIEEMENTEILLEKEIKNLEWQESENIVKQLKESLEKIGEIEEFEIYANNKK